MAPTVPVCYPIGHAEMTTAHPPRKHPSEWWTATLLRRYGPTDRTDYAVLVAVHLFARRDRDVVEASLPQIAEAARLSKPDTARHALRRLEAGGWLVVMRPAVYGRGAVTRYLVNRDRLEAAACADLGVPVDADERGAATTPFPVERVPVEGPFTETEGVPRRDPSDTERVPGTDRKGPWGGTHWVVGVEREGVGAVAAAARRAPEGSLGPTAPPLPETDDNGKPQPPPRPVQTCTVHDSWKGDHLCRKCQTDRLASENHDDALADYRAALAAWETTRCRHGVAMGAEFDADLSVGGCPECESEHRRHLAAEAERAAAVAAAIAAHAALPKCPHGIVGGHTADEHGNTAAKCDACETPLQIRHAVAGCDDPTCHGNRDASKAAVTAAAIARDLARQQLAATG